MVSKTIIITANVTVSSIVEAIKKGAFNYLEKPVDEELLAAQVRKVAELNRMQRGYHSIKTEVTSNYRFEDIVYEKPENGKRSSAGPESWLKPIMRF
jgi:two-component system response regulator AtoC